jgi:hypothetical protein
MPVTVVGFVYTNKLDSTKLITADILHTGSFESFMSRARFKLGFAAGMTIVNILAVILIIFIPIVICVKGLKQKE